MDKRLKLTAGQRRAFFAGEWPVLAGDGLAPVSAGYVHRLSSRLSLTVERVHIRKGRWRLEYSVLDDRDERFYLVPMMTSLERMAKAPLGDDGLPEMGPPEEDLGYTRDPRRVRADEGPALRPDLQTVIEMRSRLTTGQRNVGSADQRRQRERAARERLRETLDGLDPVAQIALLAQIEQMIDDAQLAERAA